MARRRRSAGRRRRPLLLRLRVWGVVSHRHECTSVSLPLAVLHADSTTAPDVLAHAHAHAARSLRLYDDSMEVHYNWLVVLNPICRLVQIHLYGNTPFVNSREKNEKEKMSMRGGRGRMAMVERR